jgi:predicted aldo/keto reductase-like oxidoreductase
MEYRIDKRSGNRLSILGFGCMRFPRNIAQIDINRSEELVLNAIKNGVNYFDTAFVYGDSEIVLGKIIRKNNIREKIFLATKLPLGRCKAYEDFDLLFNSQLERLQTDYIDYYLMHNLSDSSIWEKLLSLGIDKWIREKKASGRIRNLGFSFHGIHDEFLKILDSYEWDFCQIQYNYININYQAGMAGLKKAAEKGIPVIIMEPLLGGKLATGLSKKALNIFRSANNSITPAAWALRWLWNQKEVSVVLSGMNEMSQLEENIATANEAFPDMLTVEENKVFEDVIKVIMDTYKVPCTGCNYCMPCPSKVNIPACFAAYNVSYTAGFVTGMANYLTSIGGLTPSVSFSASNCKKCGLCEKKCPQHIPIINSLEKVVSRMEPFWMKFVVKILARVMR